MTADLPPARVLEVSPAEYHRLPGFSSSLAKILIRQSPLHAKDAYDRQQEKLADEDESDDDITDEKQSQLDRGTVLHALVLGAGAERIETIPDALLSGKNRAYSSAEAKAARDGARKAGRVPVKELKLQVHEQVANAIKSRIGAAGHVLDGRSEMAIEWHEPTPHGPVLCRCMMDHTIVWGTEPSLTPNTHPGGLIYDLKIVGDANPDRCERTADGLLYAIQAAAYPRALAALYPRLAGRIDFRFLFCEFKRPYAMWDPPVLDGAFREIGERWWRRAVNAWAEGLATGRWPGYRTPDRVEMRAPMWRLRQEGFQPEDY